VAVAVGVLRPESAYAEEEAEAEELGAAQPAYSESG
jgi:hypothetical protein